MAFKPGDEKPEGSGRKAGSPNKKNQEIFELAQELGCNPVKVLMLFAMGDFEGLGYEELEVTYDKQGKKIYNLKISPELRKSAASDLLPYMYGKRKPIDSEGNDSTSILDDILAAVDANK